MRAESWATAIDLARHLGIAKETMYRWRGRRRLLTHKIGQLWKFQPSDFDKWGLTGSADDDAEKWKRTNMNSAGEEIA